MDKITPTLWKVCRAPEVEDWGPRGENGKKAESPSLWSLCPFLTSCLQTSPGEEALRYILFLSLEQQFGVRSCLVFLISPNLSGLGESAPQGRG